ncbi:MAG: ParB-like protein [Sedimenticolaceae bacterium]
MHDYLRVRPVPIVVRKEKFYLVDHHHLVRALYDAENKQRGDDICVYVKVMANASTLEDTYFWKTMHQQNWVYLFDRAGGGPQQPNTLPTHIKDLGFDPYRSLAWIVREQHGYVKNDAPFSEFTNGRTSSARASSWTRTSSRASIPSTISPSGSTSQGGWR